jgi:MFS family permease
MLIGAGIAAAGFAATAFAGTVLDLLVWRSLCALGYAMVFVAAQGYVLEHASPGARARSFAVFIGAIMVATVCGPSIGGILADNIGERWTFGVSAVLAIGSMAAMRHMPGLRIADHGANTERPASRPPTLREIGSLLVNKRFMAVTALAAMPAKIVLTGICFYLVPLYMVTIGGSQAVTGRLLMSYAVVMVLMSPLTAALANTRERMQWLVGGGLMLSGAGGALLLAGDTTPWVFAAIVLVGFGQSLSISAQSALVSEQCAAEVARLGEPAVYGVYRLLERLGNALGPLLAGVLVLHYGYRTSFAVIGGLALFCGAAFLLSNRRPHRLALAPA